MSKWIQFFQKKSKTECQEQLEEWQAVYYDPQSESKASVPDEIYDTCAQIYLERFKQEPITRGGGGPLSTSSVASTFPNIRKGYVELPAYMGSLDKVKNEKEVARWASTRSLFYASAKLNGLGAMVQFQKRRKPTLYLHGTDHGWEGTDISHWIPLLQKNKSLPKLTKDNWIIRGELILSKDDFATHFPDAKEIRTTVFGMVKQSIKHPDNMDPRCALVHFVAYPYAMTSRTFNSSTTFQKLEELKFRVPLHKPLASLATIQQCLKEFRQKSPYPLDGLVLADDSFEDSWPSNKNPEHVVAFKPNQEEEDEQEATEILAIEWNLSARGYWKPTAQLQPVQVGPVVVSRVTLYNAKYVVEQHLGPGALIRVVRSGDTIPYVEKVVRSAKSIQYPPTPWEWNETGVDLRIDSHTKEQAQKKAWFDDEVKIEDNDCFKELQFQVLFETFVRLGLKQGEKTMHDIFDAGYQTLDAWLEMDAKMLVDAKIPKIGPKRAQNICDAIDNCLEQLDMTKLFHAGLRIEFGYGATKAAVLASHEQQLKKFFFKNKEKELQAMLATWKGFQKTATEIVAQWNTFLRFYSKMKAYLGKSTR